MSNYSTLTQNIQAQIKQNGTKAITGQILQTQLLAMITSLGAGYQYMGVAALNTNPGTPDYKCFYIATAVGTYSNFGSPALAVAQGEVAIFYYDTAWHKAVTGAASFLAKWEGAALNSEKVMGLTGASILFPYGTAVQNLRTTSLKSLGDGTHHNLTIDDAHLQEGIGPLAASYTILLAIFRAMGIPYGLVGEDTRPDSSFITQYNVPGPNIGTGVVGITNANCFLAQVAAEKAVMNPYEVTDLSDFDN